MLEKTVREREGVLIADLKGRLTMGSGDRALREMVDEALASGHRAIVLNLADVSYIDSSGLGELVGALRTTQGMGGRLKVLSPPGRVYDTLSVARLLPLFEVFQAEDEIVASFQDEAGDDDSAAEPEVLYEAAGAVASITLNRPRKFNALTRTLLSELITVLAAVRRDRDVRTVVLTGAGRAFCFGADADELREGEGALPTLELFQTVIRDIGEMAKPVIAGLNGFATGAGLDLALACDLRVMSRKAKLSSAFVKFGLVPDGGSTRSLPRIVGSARAAEMVFTGRPVDAEEALAWGLVNRVVDSAQVQEESLRWAAELAAGPARAIGAAKGLLRANATADLETALQAEARRQTEAFGGAEFEEGLRAHREKREPCFPE